MQNSVDVTKRMTVDYAAKLVDIRTEIDEMYRVIQREISTVKLAFTDY